MILRIKYFAIKLDNHKQYEMQQRKMPDAAPGTHQCQTQAWMGSECLGSSVEERNLNVMVTADTSVSGQAGSQNALWGALNTAQLMPQIKLKKKI